jgi:hypothetical protein
MGGGGGGMSSSLLTNLGISCFFINSLAAVQIRNLPFISSIFFRLRHSHHSTHYSLWSLGWVHAHVLVKEDADLVGSEACVRLA